MKKTREALETFVNKNNSTRNNIDNLYRTFKIVVDRASEIIMFNNGYSFIHFTVTTINLYVNNSENGTVEERISEAKEICKKLMFVLDNVAIDDRNVIQFSEMLGEEIKETVSTIKDIYNRLPEMRLELDIPEDDGTKIIRFIGDEFYLKMIVA